MSNDEVAAAIVRKANMMLMQYRPVPSCPQKKQRQRWDIEQIKKKVAAQLNPGELGLNIEVKV